MTTKTRVDKFEVGTEFAKRANLFHAHLDVCAQCKGQPFNLCRAGATLLHATAAAREAQPAPRTSEARPEEDPGYRDEDRAGPVRASGDAQPAEEKSDDRQIADLIQSWATNPIMPITDIRELRMSHAGEMASLCRRLFSRRSEAAKPIVPNCEHSAQSYEYVCTECHLVRPRTTETEHGPFPEDQTLARAVVRRLLPGTLGTDAVLDADPLVQWVSCLFRKVRDERGARAGLTLKGWFCIEHPCQNTFNGEEHSPRTTCRACGKPKPNMAYQNAFSDLDELTMYEARAPHGTRRA